MASNNIFSYKGFEPKQSHQYLIDNSVLLYPFAPIGNYNKRQQEIISKFIDTARSVGAGIHTTSLVISEFYNKVLKDFFEEFKKQPENAGKVSLKKDYRPSEVYKTDIEAITSQVKSIMKICNRFPDDFNDIDIDSILKNTFNADFNDAYFIELANRKNWIIVTRDYDIIDNTMRQTPVLSFLD
jgi:predicted nucleic acid-binding protein